jgi:hypothetical protein
MNRKESLFRIRPLIKTQINYEISASEAFQNNTLRPILKLQNDLLVYLFMNAKPVMKVNFDRKDEKAKTTIIQGIMKTNQKLKDQTEASVFSLMTIDELAYYLENRSEMKRRSNTMIIERLIDNLV